MTMVRTPHSQAFRPIASQSGQAMTEFVIGTLLFLLPLFLIIPMLGKYADIKSAAAQSARYVAWERTVWYGGSAASVSWPGNSKSETQIANETKQRVIAFGQGIANNDGGKGSYTTPGARHLWHNRDAKPLLKNYSDAGIGTISNQNSPDIVTSTVLQGITAVTSITGFNLETKGLYTGSASIKVVTLPIGLSLDGTGSGRFDPGPLTFTDKNVILANGWSANGSAHVRSQTAGVAPLGLLGDPTLKPIIQAAGCVLLLAFAPEFCLLEVGKIEPDVVPPDRLTD